MGGLACSYVRASACSLMPSARMTLRIVSMPGHHSDPFDRLLIAQVIVEGATLVTHDRAIANYRISTLWI